MRDALVRDFFSQPWFLALALVYGGFLWRWLTALSRAGGWSLLLSRRNRWRLILHGAGALCLILAAAGLRLPSLTQHTQLVVLADVSDSILDKHTQTARMHELLQALDPKTSDVGVVVFGAEAGTERRLSPMPELPAPGAAQSRTRAKNEPKPESSQPPIPDLQRLRSDVNSSATDIGHALDFARGLFPADSHARGRGILLLSDFRDTRGHALSAAAALSGSGIELLGTPSMLGQSEDVYVSSLRLPEVQQVGRAVPVEVTVASLRPCTVKVTVSRARVGQEPAWVDTKTIELTATAGAELRKTVRIVDPQPDSSGMIIYTARVTAANGELLNDVRSNNELSGAVKIVGASRWAVLTRSGSTLDKLCAAAGKPLGVDTQPFYTGALPARAAAYQHFDGILVDGLSADELKEPVVKALAEAVESGKGLVALGGEKAFGAGEHARESAWEQLLPVYMTPEDDRTRAVLFLIDVSKSMEPRISTGMGTGRKIDFAREQLALAVQKLKPLDRLGLITFSGGARVAAPLSGDLTRTPFIDAVQKVQIDAKTNLLAALRKAQETLKDDDSEEQLVIMLSDGDDTAGTPPEDIVAAARELCPVGSGPDGKTRRRTLFTFGIGINPQDTSESGKKMLQDLAAAGGGEFAPDFNKLAERLEQAFSGSKKDFFVRREPFALQAGRDHALLQGQRVWPVLSFRNRVKAKPHAETLLVSVASRKETAGERGENRRPDPLLVLSGADWPGAARCAALALSLDGAPGTEFLAAESTQALLPGLLDWVEAKALARPGIAMRTDAPDGEQLEIEVRASDPTTHLPLNGRKFAASLTAIRKFNADEKPKAETLKPVAPGLYRALVAVAPQTIYRVALSDEQGWVEEHFVSTPYSAEMRRFGTERAAMQELVHKAGGGSRVIENPFDLVRWAEACESSQTHYSLRPGLLVLGLLLLLLEFGTRGIKG